MRTGWQRRHRRGGPVLAALRAVALANACVLGMRGAGHRKVDARCAACAAHYFGSQRHHRDCMEHSVHEAR
jgi:hypothetical protein